MSDTIKSIGKVIDGNASRDAIHIAVEPICAAGRLNPGQRVSLNSEGLACEGDDPVGVVDPFLTDAVEEGQWFFLFVFPEQAQALRHAWTHPKFKDNDTRIKIVERISDDNYDSFCHGDC